MKGLFVSLLFVVICMVIINNKEYNNSTGVGFPNLGPYTCHYAKINCRFPLKEECNIQCTHDTHLILNNQTSCFPIPGNILIGFNKN